MPCSTLLSLATRLTAAMLATALLLGCAGRQIEIPRSTVQQKVEKKFPIEKSALVAKTILTDPEVYFKGEEVGIRLKFEGSLLSKKVRGNANVRGTLKYDTEDKKFYLEELRLVKMKVGDKTVSKSAALRIAIDALVIKKLDGITVYTLNESRRKERFAAAYMEKVEVDEKNDCLIITLGHHK